MLVTGSRRSVSFFLQAEDGIRDVAVTGVQTCALPIYARDRPFGSQDENARPPLEAEERRSEERRVGKECRTRRTTYHYKKKTYTPACGPCLSYIWPLNPRPSFFMTMSVFTTQYGVVLL